MLEPKKEQIQDTVVMIGNPGVGKSTLLNGLIGSVKFQSGVSYGHGLTTVLQEHIHQGRRYIDTPGLSDIKMRKEAAKEITQALKKGGIFRIFFVLTLESGRIKPDDKTTIQLVLEAAKEIGNNYSIIINKASKKVKGDMQTKEGFDTLAVMLNEGLSGTQSIFANSDDSDLRDEDNKLPDLSPDFLKVFWEAPLVSINPDKVQNIKADQFEEIREKLTQQIQELEKDKVLLQKKIEEQEKKFEKIKSELKKSRGEIGKLKTELNHQQQKMKQMTDEAEESKEELYEKIVKLETQAIDQQKKNQEELQRLQAELKQQREEEQRRIVEEERRALEKKQREIEDRLTKQQQDFNSHLQALKQKEAEEQRQKELGIVLTKAKGAYGQIFSRAGSGEERFRSGWGLEIPHTFTDDITNPIRANAKVLLDIVVENNGYYNSEDIEKAKRAYGQIFSRAGSGEERFRNRWGLEIPHTFTDDITNPIRANAKVLLDMIAAYFGS